MVVQNGQSIKTFIATANLILARVPPHLRAQWTASNATNVRTSAGAEAKSALKHHLHRLTPCPARPATLLMMPTASRARHHCHILERLPAPAYQGMADTGMVAALTVLCQWRRG